MDPLSVIASTIAIVQATAATYKTIQKLKGLPKEFVEVGVRFPLAQDSLRLLRNRLETQTLDEASHKAIEPCLTGCEANAKKLRDIFNGIERATANDDSVLDMYRTALLRLGKAHRVETLMNGILADLNALATNQLFREDATAKRIAVQLEEAMNQLSDLAPSVSDEELDGPQGFHQVIESGGTGHQTQYNNYGNGPNYNISGGSHTMNFGSSSRERVLEALNTSPYRARKNRNPERTPGTCEWFEHHSDFERWEASQSSSMLWVSANPGCGKSVLARYLVDSALQTQMQTQGPRTVCYFFFKDDFSDQRTATGAICCILHQLFTRRPDLFSEDLARRLDAHRAHLISSFDEVWDALVAASQQENAGEIVCILDAFDECADAERRKLSATLRRFYNPASDTKTGATLKFLVTSRPYDKIRRGFEPLDIPGLPVIHLKGESGEELAKIAQEINIYIEFKVSEMSHLLPKEKDLLSQRLQGIQHRTYLWVYLAIEWIKDETINNISPEDIASTLPTTVDEAYEKILAKSTNPKEARKLLHIVVATTRPLTVAEMDLALHLRPNGHLATDHSSAGWDRDQQDRCSRYIRNLCGLFVNVIDSKIYLLHQTAKEFLIPKPDSAANGESSMSVDSIKPVWKSSFHHTESHNIICNICLWFLCSKDGDACRGRAYNFFQYCAINWPIHFRTAYTKHTAIVVESARSLCNTSTSRFKMWFNIYWTAMQIGQIPNFNTITVASFFGLEQILQLELASGNADVNIKDDIYQRSPLSWAAENGFDNIVKLLLKGPKFDLRRAIANPLAPRGAQVDAKDRNNRTPLSYAALNGHLQVVKRLMQANASIDAMDDLNATPLYYAVCTGNLDMFREMSTGMPIDQAQDIRNMVLLSAAAAGQERVVKMLLETEAADLETRDSSQNTPLLAAIEGLHVSVVRLLLDKGADIETRNAGGMLPLEKAIRLKSLPMVTLLLDKGANIESRLVAGLLPLQVAISVDCSPIVALLLERGADTEAWASREEYLNKEAGNITNEQRGSPLLLLCGYGSYRNFSMTRLLLEHGARVEVRDYAERGTVLRWAVRDDLEREARLLLRHNADVNSTDVWGNAPLHWAKSPTMAQLLIANGAHVDAVNSAGETALHRTALSVDAQTAECLLKHGAQVNVKDGKGQTPLLVAVNYGYKNTTQMLLRYGAMVDDQDDAGDTVLSLASTPGRGDIMRILLKHGADAGQAAAALRAVLLQSKEHDFDFDVLDATKLWHEEQILIRYIGELELNRNVDEYFAQTEQVAFATSHVVPVIGFSDDPPLQGRNFSYFDTQITRLGLRAVRKRR